MEYSFLFVEPIYLQASTSRLPELKRVVVANGRTIAMEPTFKQALDVVFGRRQSTLPGAALLPDQPPSTSTPPAATATAVPALPAGELADLLRDAREAADGAQSDLDRLRAILDAIEQQAQ